MNLVLSGRYRLLQDPGELELRAEDLLLGGERTVRLYPLAEIDAQLEIPGLGCVKSLQQQCSSAGLSRLPTTVQSVG